MRQGHERGREQPDGPRAGARVMREIIRTPAFLELIRTNMVVLDPDGAREAVRAILWEDPELALSLASAVPEVVNYLVEAALETGRQLNGFPAPLLDAFLDRLANGVAPEPVLELPAVYGPLAEKVGLSRRAAGLFGGAVNALARAINRAAKENPYFVRDSLVAVDGREVGRAALSVLRSLALWGFSAVARFLNGPAGRRDKRGMRGDGT